MAVTLVVAWDTDLKEPLGVRRAVNKRHAKAMADELAEDYPWSPRISFYEEVDFIATEAGMTEAEVKRAMEQLGSTKKAQDIAHLPEPWAAIERQITAELALVETDQDAYTFIEKHLARDLRGRFLAIYRSDRHEMNRSPRQALDNLLALPPLE